MENTKGTNHGGDLRFAYKAVDCSPMKIKDAARGLEEQETYYTLINTFSRREKCDEKSSYRVDWQQKYIWCGPAKLDIDCLKMYKISVVKIQRGIFQGHVLSLLLFVIAMMLLNHALSICIGKYKLHKSQEKNQLPNIHGRHQTAKNKKELKTLIQAVRIYSEDIVMEFGIENLDVDVMTDETNDRSIA